MFASRTHDNNQSHLILYIWVPLVYQHATRCKCVQHHSYFALINWSVSQLFCNKLYFVSYTISCVIVFTCFSKILKFYDIILQDSLMNNRKLFTLMICPYNCDFSHHPCLGSIPPMTRTRALMRRGWLPCPLKYTLGDYSIILPLNFVTACINILWPLLVTCA